jgi:hypothetical protein
MRKIAMLGVAALALALGGTCANATTADLYRGKAAHRVIHHATARPMFEGRAAYAPVSPYGSWSGPVDYKSVGLSDNPDDCNKGCALSNGS